MWDRGENQVSESTPALTHAESHEMTKLSTRRSALRIRLVCLVVPFFFVALMALPSFGQNALPDSGSSPVPTPAASPAPEAKPPDPQPLPMPSMSGPLQTAPPREMEGGNLKVTGILSGMMLTEGNHIPGDSPTHWDVSNAQVFVQKTTGWWQFYLQGGTYN